MTSIEDALSAVKKHFGFDAFREGQSEVIHSVLSGNDTVVVMPTGSGKSLCFQLPALLLPGSTIVVSPLIALMKDQVDALEARRLPATFINSSLSPEGQRERIAGIRSGKFKLVYVAPERFRSSNFVAALSQAKVSLFAVDEAHCVSHWGHDFRPDYLRLKQAAIDVGRPPIVALTATATPHVRADISDQLGMRSPHAFVSGFYRSNLEIEVNQVAGIRDKVQKIKSLIREKKTGIIYTATRKAVDQVQNKLSALGIDTLGYHAGLSDVERNRAQDQFMSGEKKVIVATNAFGMGIDKPDIRFVVHFQMPGSIEAYYQEIGRAGRDGGQSTCCLLFNYADKMTHEFFIEGSFPTPETVRAVYQSLAGSGLKQINLSVSELAGRIGTKNEMSVNSALSILERAGHIERTSANGNRPSVRLRMSLKAASEVAGLSGSLAKTLLIGLVQQFDLNQQTNIEIDIDEVAHLLGKEQSDIRRGLSALSTSGLIYYEQPRRSRGILMLDTGTPGHLNVNHADIARRAAFEQRKLREMIRFCYDERCRWTFILDYFGEPHRTATCQRCDLCLSNPEQTRSRIAPTGRATSLDSFVSANRPTGIDLDLELDANSRRKRESAAAVERGAAGNRVRNSNSDRELNEEETLTIRKILACVARMNGRSGKHLVADTLKGSTNERVRNLDLDKLSTHGILRDLSRQYILDLIDSLVTAGAMKVTAGTFPLISITPFGKEVMLEKQRVRLAFQEQSGAVSNSSTRTAGGTRRENREKTPTVIQSYDFFQSGKSIDEIAAIRKLSPPTIEGHIIQCIQNGLAVDIFRCVTKSEKELVEAAIAELGVEFLSPLREVLPEFVTWRAIKIVTADVKAKATKSSENTSIN